MSKAENQKLKSLYVAKIFEAYSDSEHPITATTIIETLSEEYGITAERRSIYRDIDALIEMGYDIEKVKGGSYRLMSRQFDLEELRQLAECVHSAKFLTVKQSDNLIDTICDFCSSYQAEELKSDVLLCDRVKTNQSKTIYTIAMINEARKENRQISFKYMKHTINSLKDSVERRRGATYKVSPFYLLINEGNYYMMAYDPRFKDMRTYRVDRMKEVAVLDVPREGHKRAEQENMKTYTQRVFYMFGGEPQRVGIRFVNSLLDTAIEKFGTSKDVFYRPDDDKHFVVHTDVEISDQFFGWICGFGKRAQIIDPPNVVNEFREYLAAISSKYNQI